MCIYEGREDDPQNGTIFSTNLHYCIEIFSLMWTISGMESTILQSRRKSKSKIFRILHHMEMQSNLEQITLTLEVQEMLHCMVPFTVELEA